MCGVLYGVGLVVGSWFEDNVRRVVGGGRDTCFWTDNWVGGVPLRVRFPTFLSWLKTSARRWRIWSGAGGGRGGDAWGWRRRLHAWEEESVRECSIILHDGVCLVCFHGLYNDFSCSYVCMYKNNCSIFLQKKKRKKKEQLFYSHS